MPQASVPKFFLKGRGRLFRWMSLGIGAAIFVAAIFVWSRDPVPPANPAAKTPSVPAAKPPDGTRQMAERLRHLADTTDPEKNLYASVERARMFRTRFFTEQLSAGNDGEKLLPLRYNIGIESLLAGLNAEAIKEFDVVWGAQKLYNKPLPSKDAYALRSLMAVAWLRTGEQENCIAHHTAVSCLLPIAGEGVHRNQKGSRSAIPVLMDQLKDRPDDLKSRWLLNIAYMTLGEYPDGVPAEWRIDPKVFASDYDIGRFPEIAQKLGVNEPGLSGGVIAEDFDGDGFIDIICSHLDLRAQMRYFHNDGDGTFSDRTEAAGLIGETGALNLIQADYNNDGHPDVFMLRGGWFGPAGCQPNSLLRNNGDGTFTDVTEQAGLLSFHPTQTGVWLDYDGDGWLDLFIGNETTPGEKHPCELYHNNRDGTFTECAAASGAAIERFVKGVASADYNNDRLPDLYISSLRGGNILLRNNGDGTFTDVTAAAGVGGQKQSFPTWFFDYDNDGWEDLFVAGFGPSDLGGVTADYLGLPNDGETMRIYHNNHDGTFTDRSAETHMKRTLLPMGSNYGDLDNDGFLDFYLGTGIPDLDALTPNRMFRNAGGKFFQDVTTSAGVGHLQKGHAVAFADFDNDGDQDIYESMGGAYPGDTSFNTFYQNPGHGNHWLSLKLSGVTSNRAALGARIKVNVNTAEGRRVIYQTVSTGGSFGCSPLQQAIGLGDAKSVESVEIFWPVTGRTQTIRNIGLDQRYKIQEDETEAKAWPVKTFDLPGARSPTAGDAP